MIITTNKTVTIDADEGGEGTCVCVMGNWVRAWVHETLAYPPCTTVFTVNVRIWNMSPFPVAE